MAMAINMNSRGQSYADFSYIFSYAGTEMLNYPFNL